VWSRGYNGGVNTRVDPKPGAPQFRYRFGSAEFDEARLDLRVGGLRVDIEQRPLQVLLALLRRAGEVVTKEELLDDVWLGRPTVENVLANAVAKLRRSLGVADAERIQTVPRAGYRIDGPIDRIAVGRQLDSRLDLKAGIPVPSRPQFILDKQLGPSRDSEVWLARHAKTGEKRVYKFSTDGARLAVLKREATLYRVLNEGLGERADIARILDWNFETPPFFLESAFGGPSLLDWTTGGGSLAELAVEDRIRLLAQVAGAVTAAHGVGVLHKDLKPANVLIADPQAPSSTWRLRLTDFGSGRLLEPERLQELGITQMGLTHTQGFDPDTSGTLLYIAPELFRGQPPTVQSDVYSLGVMLYQFAVNDLRRPLTSGWERDVEDDLLREDIAAATDGDPQRRLKSAAELTERLTRRGERRAERSAAELVTMRATEVQRALERTQARRPWILAVIGLLTLGLGVSLWFYHASVESERRMAQQYQVAEALNTFMTRDLIGAANPAVSGHSDVKVIDAAKAAIPRIDAAFAAQAPDIQAALHSALQESLSGLTDAEASLQEGTKAITAYERVVPPDLAGADRARLRMVRDLDRLGRNKEVPALLKVVEADLPRIIKQDPLLQVEFLQARSQYNSEDLHQEAALTDDQASWSLLQTLNNVPPELLNRVEFSLANSLTLAGRFKDGEGFLRELIVRQSQLLGPNHQQTLYSIVVLSNNLVQQKRIRDAEDLLLPAVTGLEAALGPTHGRTLLAKRVIAQIYFLRGQYDDSIRINTDVYDSLVKKFGERYVGSIMALEWLGIGEQYRGNLTKSEQLLRTALTRARVNLPDSNALNQHIRYALADCLLDMRRANEAAPLLAGLVIDRLYEADVTPDWPSRLEYQAGRVALANGEKAAARGHFALARDKLTDLDALRWDGLPKKLQDAARVAEL
jgi:eukaryotic-like serine/threonine-protein kinase